MANRKLEKGYSLFLPPTFTLQYALLRDLFSTSVIFVSVRLFAGSLKKLWTDCDEIFSVTSYWAKLELIKFWTQYSLQI